MRVAGIRTLSIRLTAQELFALHPNIELAVCGNVKGHVFFREHSPTVKMPVTPDSQEQFLLYYLDETFVETSRRLRPILGKTEYTLMCYERWFELFIIEGDVYLVAALSRATDIQAIPQLAAKMHEMLLKAL